MKAQKSEARMSNDARIAVLETTILNINTTLNRIDNKIDALENKIEKKIEALDAKFENKFDAMDAKFDTKFDIINNRLWSNFLWLMGMMIGLAGLIAHTQHWI